MTTPDLKKALLALREEQVRAYHRPLLRQYQSLLRRGAPLTKAMKPYVERILADVAPRSEAQREERLSQLRALLGATN